MRVTRIRRTLSLIAGLALVTSGASALIDVATAPAGATTTNVSVPSTAVLTDMGIALNAGQSVTITASGIVTIRSGPSPTTDETPDGNGETSSDGMSCSSVGAVAVAFPLGNAGCWSLIGEVGSGPLFEVGSSLAFTASASGELFLGINDNAVGDNAGSWSATITTYNGAIGFSPVTSPQTFAATNAAGATVSYTSPTASDAGGSVPVNCLPASGTTFAIGSNTVTCTATDPSATPTSAQTTFTVNVVDESLAITPGINPPASPVASATSTAMVSFTPPTASDFSGPVTVVCDHLSGSLFSVGPTTVTCTATKAGDVPSSAQTTLTVQVYVAPPPTAPGPPIMQFVTAKNVSASVQLLAGYDGGSSIISISTTCVSSDGGATGSATGPFGPLLVTGLTNGHTYTCTATEKNAIGTSTASSVSNTFVAGAVEVTCNSSQTCDAVTSNPTSSSNPAALVDVSGTPFGQAGTISVSEELASLHCPGLPAGVAQITSLDDTGFPPTSNLAATVTQFAVASGPGRVCYSSTIPFLSVTHPSVPTAGTFLLLQCSATGNIAPCQLSSQQIAGAVVVKILIPGGDPLFNVVIPTGRLLWPSSFPTGKVGTAYSAHLQAKGGKAPIHWKVQSGKLPPGLTLSASSGVISGKPTAKGSFSCVVKATDSETPPASSNIVVKLTIS